MMDDEEGSGFRVTEHYSNTPQLHYSNHKACTSGLADIFARKHSQTLLTAVQQAFIIGAIKSNCRTDRFGKWIHNQSVSDTA